MGHHSTVYGYITLKDNKYLEDAKVAIDNHSFDEAWPFTNIFSCDSPARYSFPTIHFGGSYKQIEEGWNEWLWKFTQLLTKLEALYATVHLSCVIGDFAWELLPESKANQDISSESYKGQEWYISKAPEKDFSIEESWEEWVGSSMPAYKWDKFVKRKEI